jgi:hypothetical protein
MQSSVQQTELQTQAANLPGKNKNICKFQEFHNSRKLAIPEFQEFWNYGIMELWNYGIMEISTCLR